MPPLPLLAGAYVHASGYYEVGWYLPDGTFWSTAGWQR